MPSAHWLALSAACTLPHAHPLLHSTPPLLTHVHATHLHPPLHTHVCTHSRPCRHTATKRQVGAGAVGGADQTAMVNGELVSVEELEGMLGLSGGALAKRVVRRAMITARGSAHEIPLNSSQVRAERRVCACVWSACDGGAQWWCLGVA
jgi:hypothetical protein